MAVRAHALEVSQLSKETLDAICLTSSQLRVCAFDMLQDRPVDPYTPPIRWLRMSYTSTEVWRRVREMVREDEDSIINRWIQTVPNAFNDEAIMVEENCQGLLHLLHRTPDDILNEPWNESIEKSYRFVVCYIGFVSIAIKNNNVGYACRLLCVFPMWTSSNFVQSVESSQPRALVPLAHYFALLTLLRDYWYIGDAGTRELRAIVKAVPPQWRERMKRPLEMSETQSFLLQEHLI
jgi:hypothetical protein